MPKKYQNGPFEHVSWPAEKKEAIEVFEQWHDFLANKCRFSSSEEAQKAFADVKAQLQNNDDQDLIPSVLLTQVRKAIATHDLPSEWLFGQLDVAHHFYGPVQIKDAKELKSFITRWEAPHAYLSAKLADAAYTWQRKLIDELTMGFFVVDMLLRLPEYLEKGRVFVPLSELEHANVSVQQLKQGERTDAVQRLLWKQTIRARDAFAQGQPLVRELERKYRGTVKKNWLTALEYINEIEKRKYDVWSIPIELSTKQRFQIFVLSVIGRGASKARG
ncbi:MAG: squalene/phytoene synthase family protein [Rhodothermaceae bacterium]|nr:squalene/phytoene synthase family protein [Rhodothermaceae bacterium]